MKNLISAEYFNLFCSEKEIEVEEKIINYEKFKNSRRLCISEMKSYRSFFLSASLLG